MHHGLTRRLDQAMAGAPVSRSTLENLLVLLASGDASLHSWHCLPPPPAMPSMRASGAPTLAVGQQYFHLERVALRHAPALTERAIARRVLLAAVFRAGGRQGRILARGCHGHALGRGLLGLELLRFLGCLPP